VVSSPPVGPAAPPLAGAVAVPADAAAPDDGAGVEGAMDGVTDGTVDGVIDGATVDTLLRGRVTLFQPERGFRSSLDPLLLARFLAPPFGRFLDIGCGTGALSFALAAIDPESTGVAVEIQPRLARLAAAGRERNGLTARLEMVEGDVRRLSARLGAARFDLVATNPPFRPIAGGVASPDEERALANHEVALTLDQWLDVAAAAVRPAGRVGVVYAADRLPELLAGLAARALQPVRLRCVHPRADRPAGRVLVEAQRASRRPLAIEPPLVVHEAGGGFTAEARRMLEG
jgi:tRNA1Val (adenine37-N6)-methyltransferase